MAKINDPGFGYKSDKKATRLVNNDGSFNMKHINRNFSISELYTYLIHVSWGKFFFFVFLGYTLVNLLFATLYYSIGIEQLTLVKTNSSQDFINAFFFSSQTLTTLGYGAISPVGNAAGFISSFEALIGLLSFSFFTGLLYGRFSKPKAAIRFSETMILRPFNGKRALMFRLMNKRKNIMIEPGINVTMAVNSTDEKGGFKRQFFELTLERKQIMYMPTTWTIVHEIDEDSPLYQYSDAEIGELQAELFLLIEYYEDAFSQNVYQLHSYDFNAVEIGKKFVPAYYFDSVGNGVLDHNKLSETESM